MDFKKRVRELLIENGNLANASIEELKKMVRSGEYDSYGKFILDIFNQKSKNTFKTYGELKAFVKEEHSRLTNNLA